MERVTLTVQDVLVHLEDPPYRGFRVVVEEAALMPTTGGKFVRVALLHQ